MAQGEKDGTEIDKGNMPSSAGLLQGFVSEHPIATRSCGEAKQARRSPGFLNRAITQYDDADNFVCASR